MFNVAFLGVMRKFSGGIKTYTAKSVILDIADSYGSNISLRSIEFLYNGVVIPMTTYSADFTTSQTSYASSNYAGYRAVLITASKIGSQYNNEWLATAASMQRLNIVFTSVQKFDGIKINNSHESGYVVSKGVKNVKIYISTDAITSTVYDSAISNSTKIFDGQFNQHSAINEADSQILELIAP